jgi:Reverse transcriptase (RNA-dependent DNA polymerase).
MDYTFACDCINSNELYQAMETFIVPSKLIRLVELTIRDTLNCVKIQSDLSDLIHTGEGLCQGEALVCLLFNIALEKANRYQNTDNQNDILSICANESLCRAYNYKDTYSSDGILLVIRETEKIGR